MNFDKTFFFATCDSDKHCSMDATVALLNVEYVTAVCLYIYTIAGTMTGSWKVLLGSWKSPGIYFGQDSGNPSFDMGLLEARDAVQNRSF